MRKQLLGFFIGLVAVLASPAVFGQSPVCQIVNDFSGASQQFPGNYSVSVSPGAVGTLTADCGSFVNIWNWSPGSATTPSIQVTAPSSVGSIAYTLVGCIGTNCSLPVTITIVVEQAGPDCTLSASPDPATSGQTVTFTASCTPPAAEIHYTDLSGVARVSTSLTFTDVAPAVRSPQVYQVLYRGVSAGGVPGVQKLLELTINPPVVPPPSNCTLTANPNPVTINNSFTLSAACTGGGAVTNYVFAGPNGASFASGASNTTTVQATTLGPQAYSVRAQNSGGEATASTTVNVVAVPPSSCTLVANPTTVFVGQQTFLTARCSVGDQPSTYTFTLPGGAQVTQATATLAHAPQVPGNATYTVVAGNSGGNSPAASATVVVLQPSCTISASPQNPVPRNTPVTLTASCNTSPSIFQWSTAAGPIPGQSGPSITVTPAVTTTYTVSGTAASTQSPVTATGQYTVIVSDASAIANIVSATITGLPGRPLSRALEVRVTDQAGAPVAGENVNWSVVNPGPSPGTFAATTTGPTNQQGLTTNTFTMGSDAGGRTLRACLALLPSVCADFTIIPGASQLVAIAGAPLVGSPGRSLRELAVQARDAAGNGVPGESVTWSVVNPGANPGTFAANPTGPTNAQGITTNTFTMGADPGGRTLRACLVSAPTACVDFVVRSLDAAVVRPATKIMSPMAEVAVQTPLTQIYNVRMRLEQLRLRRNPSVIEALKVSVAGRALPSWSAFALGGKDRDGKPQRGGGAAADQDPFERLGAFVNGDVEIGRQSATGLSNGYELTTKGITAGVDYRLPGESVIGVAAGYMKADTDLAESGGNQDASGYSFSAYGSFVPMPGTYLDVIAHAGNNKYDTRRREPVDGGGTTEYASNTKGRQFAAAVTFGSDFNRGAVTMNPYLRVDYVDAKINGFSESGDAGSIAVKDLDLRNTVVTAGGQVSYAMSTSWGVLMPNARLELQRRVQGDNRNVTAALVADGTINAVAPLESVDRNYGNFTIGASAVLPRGISGFVNIERLFGRESYSNTKYTLGVRLEF
jgi:uncharacterized protein YhjY with autotransporter beta-barrel domain